MSAGVSIGLNKSLQQVKCVYNPPAEYKGRTGAVRLVRGDVDLSVVVAYMWPEPSCVSDRERNRGLWLYLDCIISNAPGRSIPLLVLDVNGHTGFQMAQPKVWRPVESDAIGPRFPQGDNFNSGQLRLVLDKVIS